ncbi:MAG: sulfotransferase family 2 domain-containing protein [Crocosphaera sp.]|nr:sulfotransferase family 2 domain-containing protein [Crocosphaera sp.]
MKQNLSAITPKFLKRFYRERILIKNLSIKDYSQQSIDKAIDALRMYWNIQPDFILRNSFILESMDGQQIDISNSLNLEKITSKKSLILCASRIDREYLQQLNRMIDINFNLCHISIINLYLSLIKIRKIPTENIVFHQIEKCKLNSINNFHLSVEKSQVDLSDVFNFRILFEKLNLLFYEVPKNASSSIKTILFSIENDSKYDPRYSQYMFFEKWQKQFPAMKVNWEDITSSPYLKFSFLRNPYDRVVSGYKNTAWQSLNQDITFEEFVDQLPEKLSSPASDLINIHYQPFTYFIPKIDGKLYIDFIGKVENFDDDIRAILKASNVVGNFRIPKINTSRKEDYRDFYTSRTKKIVTSLYEEDIELGKYTF